MVRPKPAEEAKAEAEHAYRLAAGETLFAHPCTFVAAAQHTDHLPPPELPEIAFCGRSNVGKSSLLNALVSRHGLARVSHTPGRTQQLNFFALGGRLMLVDLPGYGYAKAPKQMQRDWQGLIFDYLRGRPNLARVLLLLDARIETKPSDRAAMALLDQAAVSFQIVLTKADGIAPPRLRARQAEAQALARAYTAAHPRVITTSSRSNLGIADLRAEIASLLASPAMT